MKRALVLAGGGVAGIAWELGVLLGLRDGAPSLFPDLLRPELTVGTSAGSAVAAQLASDLDLETLYDRQFALDSGEIAASFDVQEMVAKFGAAMAGVTGPLDARQRIGAIALEASTVPESARLEVMRHRLPSHEWPDHRLVITAVDCVSGELVLFDSQSGVPLVDAVAASCAVPVVWPPVTIDGRRYMDGGMASGANIRVAAGSDRVLLLTPSPVNTPPLFGEGLAAEIAAVGTEKVFVVEADDASRAAFGTNPLDPATRVPSAEAGRALGRARAAELLSFWE